MEADDKELILQEQAQRLQALDQENAHLRQQVAALRGPEPPRGSERTKIGKLTKRVRMALTSSGALVVALVVALTAGVAVAATFGTFNAETLNGTEQADDIDGLAGSDKIYGLGGDDNLKGNEGADTIQGGEGEDNVQGGEGNDVIDLGPGHDGSRGPTRGGPGNDIITGGGGVDLLYGEGGDDKLYGGPGENYLLGGPGNNTYFGDSTTDYIYADLANEAAGGAREVISAGAGDDTILTDDGLPDQIKCGDGTDTVDNDSVDSVSADCENKNVIFPAGSH